MLSGFPPPSLSSQHRSTHILPGRAMSPPLPRLPFPLPSHTPSWYAGHMAAALRDLPALLRDVDLVLEARDARLPLTSVNPALDEVVSAAWGGAGSAGRQGEGWRGRKRKVVVYTKRDLAERRFEQVRVRHCSRHDRS